MSGFTEVLSRILTSIFEKVLAPILEAFLKSMIDLAVKLLKDVFAWVEYYLFTTLLSVVKFLDQAFEFFAGTDRGLVISEGKSTTLIQAVFGMSAIHKLFVMFTAVGIALAIIFSVIQTAKSMSSMTLEDKYPISTVLKTAMKTAISFAIIPLLCTFLLQLSSTLINVFDEAVGEATGQGGLTIDKVLWLDASLNAANNPSWNVNNANAEVLQKIGTTEDPYRYYYLYGDYSYMYTDITKNNSNESNFKDFFSYAGFDNILGIVSAVVVILILTAVLIAFIRRIFELIVLYVVGPMFAATMPLDEGKMYKKWKDTFISKFFAGFGPIIGMRLYMSILPIICSGKIMFTTQNGMLNSIIQLLFVIGGAYTVYKSQSLFMKILNPEAAMQEEMNSGMGMMLAGFAGSAAMGAVGAGIGGMMGGGQKGGKGGGQKTSDSFEPRNNDSNSSGNEANIPAKPSE